MAAVSANNIGDYNKEIPIATEEPAVKEEVVSEDGTTEQPMEGQEDDGQEQEINEEENEETNEEEVDEAKAWDIEHLKDENGLVAGKYKNIDAMVKSMEHAEAKLQELMSEKQSNNAKSQNEAANAAKQAEITAKENEAINKYVENGKMTPELMEEIEASGLDKNIVELRGIKAEQKINQLYSMVDGKDTFNQMITDMSEGKSQEQKDAWLAAVSNPDVSEYAVKGLYNEWLEQTGQRKSPSRISGKPSNQGSVKPYTSQADMLKDANRARNDRAFRAEYESRKSVTPDSVFFSR